MSEARFDIIDQRLDRVDERLDGVDQRLDRMDERFDRMDERFDRMDERMDRMDGRMDRMDGRMDRMESNILAITASTARIEGALPHLATKEDVVEAKLYATKSQRAMVVSMVAAGVAVAGVVARLWSP